MDATGPIGSTPSTKSAERKAGSRCERAFCGRGAVGRTDRAPLCSTRAAAQEPVPPRRPLPMAHHRRSAARHSTAANRLGGDAHGSWSLPSHSRLGGDGEGAPAGGSAGGSRTELNSHSRCAPQGHSTSDCLDRARRTLECSAGKRCVSLYWMRHRDPHACWVYSCKGTAREHHNAYPRHLTTVPIAQHRPVRLRQVGWG